MKCPTCRRTLDESTVCPRCGADLGELLALEEEFESALRRGRALLRFRQPRAAEKAFRRAFDIHADNAEAARGLALAELCRGDFRGALLRYLQIRARSVPGEC